MRWAAWGAACLSALWLAGCALPPAPDSGAASGAVLGPPLERFTAEGRIALRQGERRDHLRFRWEHAPDSDAVLLMSPLGQGMAELSRDAAGARLNQAGQPPRTAPDLRQLAQAVFGVPLPLEALADWLRGAQPVMVGEVREVEGWRVVVGEATAYRQHRLLRMLEVQRGEVELKLLVDDWAAEE